MTTLTQAEKMADLSRARDLLNGYADDIKSEKALVLISVDYGKGVTDYLRVAIAGTDSTGKVQTGHLTWAIAKALGYTLKSRNGYWFLAISGGGYSKSDEIARHLAIYYGIDRVRYEQF